MNQSLTVLVPCYNEAQRISGALDELKAWLSSHPDFPIKLHFIDDGSEDETVQLIEQSELADAIIKLPMNLGKGGALAAGMPSVETDYVLVMDADLSTSLECIQPFYDYLSNSSLDLIVANRSDPESRVTRSWSRGISSRIFSFLVRVLGDFNIHDTQCGFKMFKTKVAQDLFKDLSLTRYSFDLEILWRASQKYKIGELPIVWIEKEGSKIRLLKDGITMLKDLIKIKRDKLETKNHK